MPLLENISHPPPPPPPHHPIQPLLANQNLMHVKFHVNKFQDNLLSKRLQQLNTEEMKSRLKYQRTSNELLYFLRECQKTTGYYSKMNEYKNQMQSSTDSFESKSFCANYASTKCSSQRPPTALKRPSTGFSSNSGSGISKFRSTSYNNCFPQDESGAPAIKPPLSASTKKFTHFVEEIETTPPKCSLFIDNLPITTPNTPNSANSQSTSTSKTSSSRNSNSSSVFSSNSSESLVEVVGKEANLKQKPILIRPQTAQATKLFIKVSKGEKQQKTKKFNQLGDSTTISNIDWYSTPLNFDLDDFRDELDSNNSSEQLKSSNRSTTARTTNTINSSTVNTQKLISHDKKSKSKSDFKSKSMNFPSTTRTTNSTQNVPSFTHRTSFLPLSSTSNSLDITRTSRTTSLKSGLSNSSLDLFNSRSSENSMSSHHNQSNKARKMFVYNKNLPIKINMSRTSIRKKQLEIMDEYSRYNTLELLNSLRQIQRNLDTKVKQFANNKIELDSNT